MAIYTASELLKKHGVKPTEVKSVGISQPEEEKEESPGFFGNVSKAFEQRTDRAADAQNLALEGKQSDRSAALQTIGQGAGFIGDIATEGVKAVTPDSIENLFVSGLQKIAGTEKAQQIAKSYMDWKTAHPEAAANLEAVGNIVGLAPAGAAAAKATQAGVKGALVGSGKALEVTADAIALPGKVIRGAGSTLYKTAITPNAKEAQQILNYRAKTPFLTRLSETLDNTAEPPRTRGQTALEQGLAGTESAIGVQAKRVADILYRNEIAPLVAKSDVKMTKDELFTPALERIAATEDPTRKAALQNAYEALLEDYKSYPESFDLTKAQALKRDLAKFTPAKVFKGQDVASDVRMLQADIASAIRTKTYEALKDENIRKKYLDWANLDELQKVGVKAISEAQFKAGSGTLLSGLWDMATTPVKTIGGQVLYRVGGKLEFEAPKGIKTFGQYLQQKGYQKPTEYNLPKSELSIGLAIKDITSKPDAVAKKITKEDRDLIAAYLDRPEDTEAYMQMQPLFESLRLENAPDPIIRRFLTEVMDLSNI